MELFHYGVIALNLLILAALVVYSANCYVLIATYRRHRKPAERRSGELRRKFHDCLPDRGWPPVTVQLPVFNERYVVERLIESVCRLDYPRDRLEVQVLDDSTDDTTTLAAAAVARMRARGVHIVLRHRQTRDGFKAGALAAGLQTATGEFIAIFDADFVPPRDFLQDCIPYFLDERIGMLQARWGHLNAGYSLLTRAQAIGIDGHFAVEQSSRAWGGLFLNFNGAAGVWRRQAIEEAGGWQTDTLTEDLDLSYRAQLIGWKLMVAPQIVCPAEVPVTITALKSQQHRWAKGSIQTARKTLGRVLGAPLPLRVKFQACLHLTRYLVHPLMLAVVLLSIPMLHTPLIREASGGPLLLFGLLWLSSLGPSALYLMSQRALYRDWRRNARFLPALMGLAVGVSVNNTKAVVEALLNVRGGFVRTPKYGIESRGGEWRDKSYRLPATGVAIGELACGCYALLGVGLFLHAGKLLPGMFLMLYTLGFFYVFSLSLRQSRRPAQTKDRRPKEACGDDSH
jgi:cellulose synthase/poly-beta-1,6-N-acetylglucosamine synthase-like glycosyltransferase